MRRLVVVLICFGATMNALAVGLSNTNGSIYLAVAAITPAGGFVSTEPIPFDAHLIWGAFMDSGKVEVNYPAPAYGIKVRMIGADGKEVAKTALGRSYGANWDKLHSFKDGRLGSTDAWGPFDLRGGGFSGRPLPAPKELFQMQLPGVYTMEIQMQIFRHTGSTNPAVWYTNLMRFSPVRITVQKPR